MRRRWIGAGRGELMQIWFLANAVFVVWSSLLLFSLYAIDKRRAKLFGQRMPERFLHRLAVMGGWPGAIAGQFLFRHKTKKRSFRVVFFLTLIVHLGWFTGGTYLVYQLTK